MEEWELNSAGLGWEPIAGSYERSNGLCGSIIFSTRILLLGDFYPSQPLKSKLQISEAMWQCALMYLVDRVSSEVPRRQYSVSTLIFH
jgi:hypothetical protein